jgi:hypothetical protein
MNRIGVDRACPSIADRSDGAMFGQAARRGTAAQFEAAVIALEHHRSLDCDGAAGNEAGRAPQGRRSDADSPLHRGEFRPATSRRANEPCNSVWGLIANTMRSFARVSGL